MTTRGTARPGPGRVRSGAEDRPKYEQMIRGQSRLRPDQVADLTALRRALMDARTQKSERITDNTLIRVAVDLLLSHADELEGDTEDELIRSVVKPDTKAAPKAKTTPAKSRTSTPKNAK